jgi:tRNA(Ile)-lysidine synthase
MLMIDHLRAFAARHGLWHPDTRVISALSGGADSVALLVLLRELHDARDLILEAAVHLHHGIRGAEADADQAFCRELCERLGVVFLTSRVDVPAVAAVEGLSLEVAARRARQVFFDHTREARGAHVVATAHTENDQAETILLRLVRGTGSRGLGGIAPRRGHLIRPLLSTSREAIVAELGGRHQAWREDATNTDLANPRNRVRHELIPYLRNHFNPSVSGALSRLADITRSDETWMEGVAGEMARGIVEVDEGSVSLDVSRFQRLPEGLARRVARYALETAHPGRTFDLRETDGVLAIIAGPQTAAEFSGLRVERFRDSAVLIKRAPKARPRRRGATAGV